MAFERAEEEERVEERDGEKKNPEKKKNAHTRTRLKKRAIEGRKC